MSYAGDIWFDMSGQELWYFDGHEWVIVGALREPLPELLVDLLKIVVPDAPPEDW